MVREAPCEHTWGEASLGVDYTLPFINYVRFGVNHAWVETPRKETRSGVDKTRTFCSYVFKLLLLFSVPFFHLGS